jgi:hypothetical protein
MIRRIVRQTGAVLVAGVLAALPCRAVHADFSSAPLVATPFGGTGFGNPQAAAPAAAQQPHPAVARIIVPEKDGTSYGSGTLVDVTESQGLVITNHHVVRDQAGPITVVFPDGFRSQATVIKADKTWDLAALSIWRPNVAPVAISAQRAQPGEPLAIAGYGSGNYRMAAGRCTQYVSPGAQHPFEMVEVSAAARQGDSGGPILNSRGELAGVLFGEGDGKTAGADCGRVAQFLTPIRGTESMHLAQLTSNRTTSGPAYTNANAAGATGDGWQAADAPRQPAGDPFARLGADGFTATDSMAGRIAPSANSPRPGMGLTDPRFMNPAPAATNPGSAGAWTWPNAGAQANAPNNAAPWNNSAQATPGAEARPSYPLPAAAPTSIASPAAVQGEGQKIGNFLGETGFEQAKSVLAIIGLIAVIVTFGRAFSKT